MRFSARVAFLDFFGRFWTILTLFENVEQQIRSIRQVLFYRLHQSGQKSGGAQRGRGSNFQSIFFNKISSGTHLYLCIIVLTYYITSIKEVKAQGLLFCNYSHASKKSSYTVILYMVYRIIIWLNTQRGIIKICF